VSVSVCAFCIVLFTCVLEKVSNFSEKEKFVGDEEDFLKFETRLYITNKRKILKEHGLAETRRHSERLADTQRDSQTLAETRT